jgi:tripartite-type tricarboxylate transporter receptor subunit TctC
LFLNNKNICSPTEPGVRVARLALCVAGLVTAAVANGQTAALAPGAGYPVKPIRMIVPFPPGGGNDILARTVSQRLTEVVHQQIIIDNRGGAGGALGAQIAISAPPDGYTVFLGSVGNLAQNPVLQEKPTYDPLRDFAPVTLLATSVFVLAVNNAVPAKTVQELIALAKAKPGALNYASAGNGSSLHLAAEIFKHATATRIVHVPYKGANPAFVDMIAGQVQMILTTMPAALPHIRAGKVRALGTSGRRRASVLPEVPTIAETLPGFEILNWQGITAPARTPAAIVQTLHAKLLATLKMPGMNEALQVQGLDAAGAGPVEFGALMKSEIAKYSQVVKAAGIRGD